VWHRTVWSLQCWSKYVCSAWAGFFQFRQACRFDRRDTFLDKERYVGWKGKILRIDLHAPHQDGGDAGPPDEGVISAQGMCARILFDEIDPRIDALSPDNRLIFATGPLTAAGHQQRAGTLCRPSLPSATVSPAPAAEATWGRTSSTQVRPRQSSKAVAGACLREHL